MRAVDCAGERCARAFPAIVVGLYLWAGPGQRRDVSIDTLRSSWLAAIGEVLQGLGVDARSAVFSVICIVPDCCRATYRVAGEL